MMTKAGVVTALATIVTAAVFLDTGSPAELAYTCEITAIYDLNDEGELERSGFDAQIRRSQFSVSRTSGEIVGETLTTILAESTTVINFGSPQFSFKTLAFFTTRDDGINQAQLLEIQEFRDGPEKPFVAMSMGGAGIVTGLCR